MLVYGWIKTVGRLTNHPDCFQKFNFLARFAPSTATTTPKNEIAKLVLFYLVYLVEFNFQGLNLAQKSCTEMWLQCFCNCSHWVKFRFTQSCLNTIIALKSCDGLSGDLQLGVASTDGGFISCTIRRMVDKPWTRDTSVCTDQFGLPLINSGMTQQEQRRRPRFSYSSTHKISLASLKVINSQLLACIHPWHQI
jgi:hypothetical protein